MKTISYFSLIFCLLFTVPALAQDIVGSGISRKETRNVNTFDKIDVGLIFHLTLTQGNKQRVSIEADDNILPYLETYVKDRTLYIRTKNNQGFDSKSPMHVYITLPVLRKINASGATKIESTTPWKTGELELDLSAAAQLELEIDVTKLKLDLSAASNVQLQGKATLLEADFSGATKFNGENLTAGKAEIDISGAAQAELHVSNEIEYEASGTSQLIYSGSPRILKAEVSTNASVRTR